MVDSDRFFAAAAAPAATNSMSNKNVLPLHHPSIHLSTRLKILGWKAMQNIFSWEKDSWGNNSSSSSKMCSEYNGKHAAVHPPFPSRLFILDWRERVEISLKNSSHTVCDLHWKTLSSYCSTTNRPDPFCTAPVADFLAACACLVEREQAAAALTRSPLEHMP